MFPLFYTPVEPVLLDSTQSVNETSENRTATFSCIAAGYPEPDVVWLRNGSLAYIPGISSRESVMINSNITSPLNNRSDITIAVNSTLVVRNLLLKDSGDYSCRVDPAVLDKGRAYPSPSLTLHVQPG